MSRPALPLLALAATLTLAACGGGEQTQTLTVAVTPVPHADILQFVSDELAEEAGLEIEIVEFTDYVQPNVALDDGSVDANYFQHTVYLADQAEQGGYDFTSLGSVSFQPMGLYSEGVGDLAEIPDGATVAIPNDPVNGSRGIDLLAQEGLITLAPDAPEIPTVLDIADNPHGLRFEEVEAAQLPRSLSDVDVAAIPGNYAIGADLNPSRDALVTEAVEGTPYANQLVVRSEDADDEALATLYELLTGPEVKDYINQTYDGAVVQAG